MLVRETARQGGLWLDKRGEQIKQVNATSNLRFGSSNSSVNAHAWHTTPERAHSVILFLLFLASFYIPLNALPCLPLISTHLLSTQKTHTRYYLLSKYP